MEEGYMEAEILFAQKVHKGDVQKHYFADKEGKALYKLFEKLAKSVVMTTEELNHKLSIGEVLPRDVLDMIGIQLD